MKLVFNRSQNTIVYGEGLMVVAGDWAYVDENDNAINKALGDGRLIVKDIPDSMPSNVSDDAATALKAAIDDRKSEAVEIMQADEEDTDDRPVRNTGRSRTKSNSTKGA